MYKLGSENMIYRKMLQMDLETKTFYLCQKTNGHNEEDPKG